MSYTPREGPKTWLVGGIFFILFAVYLFCEARSADRAGGTIPYSPQATWMSPAQAYVGSVFLFAFGVFGVVSGVRMIRRTRSSSDDRNI